MSSEPIVSESGVPAAPSVETTVVTGQPAAPTTIAPTEPAPAAPAAPANWRDGLSADLRSNPTLEQIPDVETLALNHVNVQKLIGGEKIPRPNENWGEEEWNNHFTQLGRPSKAEDYDLEGIDGPEGVPADAELQSAMVGEMHKLGLNSDQVKGILGFYNNAIGDQYQQGQADVTQARDTGIQELRNEWGKSFPAQVDLAMRAFKSGAGEGFEELAAMELAGGGLLGDHPAIIKAFAALGNKTSEHGLVGATAKRSTFSPEESLTAIATLEAESAHILTDKSHPEHEAMLAKRSALYASAYPEE